MAMEIGLMICLDSLEDKNFKFYLRCGIAGFRTVFYAQTRAVELCRWSGARVARRAEEKAFLLDLRRQTRAVELCR